MPLIYLHFFGCSAEANEFWYDGGKSELGRCFWYCFVLPSAGAYRARPRGTILEVLTFIASVGISFEGDH